MSCFQGLFYCQEASSMLFHNFCIYHISPPGHEVCELGAVCNILVILYERLLLLLVSLLILYIFQELFQLGAVAINPDEPVLSVDDLADQIVDVLDYFG